LKQAAGAAGRVHVLRLQPGEDVRIKLNEWVNAQRMEAAAITSAVGSLTHAHLRYANRADGIMTTADLEVLSLSGTLSIHGMHLHLSVADRDGKMLGGHMLDGCIVRTTLELTVQEIEGVRMLRVKDEQSGYEELSPETK
jgi:predicted DNA-binding protein with PD1-like motif